MFGKEVLPEFKERDQQNASRKASEVPRLSDLRIPRRAPAKVFEPTIIHAAGRH